jgi:G6PDH family F420-dependent oxidoreductase
VSSSQPLTASDSGTSTAANTRIGYALSSEEFSAPELVELAVAAEESGLQFALISDHFHPWTRSQGNSPFVWSTLGAISQATERLILGTGVTCPTMRVHPAIIAQAAATAATLLPDRFFLGVGSGERLNEHITGLHWPDNATRLRMLEEAVEVIRSLWSGEEVSHHGEFFTVERAQVFSLPEQPPPIYFAAGGPKSAKRAGSSADGLIGVSPDSEMVGAYVDAASAPGPRLGLVQFCWNSDRDQAVETVLRYWPNAAWSGNLNQELATPRDFEGVAELVKPEDLEGKITLGNDPAEFVAALNKYVDAGYDHIYFHQVGRDQREALDFISREVIPAFKAQG